MSEEQVLIAAKELKRLRRRHSIGTALMLSAISCLVGAWLAARYERVSEFARENLVYVLIGLLVLSGLGERFSRWRGVRRIPGHHR